MTTVNPDNSLSKDSTDLSSLAFQTVNAIEEISGVHAGYRRAHAKGICCHAVFRPNNLAKPFTTAPHFQDKEVNAIVRFSGSSSDPAISDFLSPAKGIAVQFLLPEDRVTNLIGATLPVFFARTPESFLDIIQAVHQAKEKTLGPIDLFQEITSHFSESKESLLAVKHLMPPVSYAKCQYYCIHCYFFVDKEYHQHPVKFEWIPDAGVHTLSIVEAMQEPEDYLEDELKQRLKDETVVFSLDVIFGKAEDPTDDPTKAWPSERQRMNIGKLYISEVIDEPDNLIMDPAIITEGMALTDDPILKYRHAVYVDSHHRRQQER